MRRMSLVEAVLSARAEEQVAAEFRRITERAESTKMPREHRGEARGHPKQEAAAWFFPKRESGGTGMCGASAVYSSGTVWLCRSKVHRGGLCATHLAKMYRLAAECRRLHSSAMLADHDPQDAIPPAGGAAAGID